MDPWGPSVDPEVSCVSVIGIVVWNIRDVEALSVWHLCWNPMKDVEVKYSSGLSADVPDVTWEGGGNVVLALPAGIGVVSFGHSDSRSFALDSGDPSLVLENPVTKSAGSRWDDDLGMMVVVSGPLNDGSSTRVTWKDASDVAVWGEMSENPAVAWESDLVHGMKVAWKIMSLSALG